MVLIAFACGLVHSVSCIAFEWCTAFRKVNKWLLTGSDPHHIPYPGYGSSSLLGVHTCVVTVHPISTMTHAPFHASMLRPSSWTGPMH